MFLNNFFLNTGQYALLTEGVAELHSYPRQANKARNTVTSEGGSWWDFKKRVTS